MGEVKSQNTWDYLKVSFTADEWSDIFSTWERKKKRTSFINEILNII